MRFSKRREYDDDGKPWGWMIRFDHQGYAVAHLVPEWEFLLFKGRFRNIALARIENARRTIEHEIENAHAH